MTKRTLVLPKLRNLCIMKAKMEPDKADIRPQESQRKEAIMPKIVNTAEFDELIAQSETPVLVDFFATWCGPCKMLAPVLEEVAAQAQGRAQVVKVDIDESPELAQRYGVMSVPTLMSFTAEQPTATKVGVQPKQVLLSMIGL